MRFKNKDFITWKPNPEVAPPRTFTIKSINGNNYEWYFINNSDMNKSSNNIDRLEKDYILDYKHMLRKILGEVE